jgi:hypothetical protein
MRPKSFSVARPFEVASSVKHYVISKPVIDLCLLRGGVELTRDRVKPSLIVSLGF